MNTTQRSFASGELSPALYAHTDQVKYTSGLRTCRNMQIRRTGGADNRAGTEFIEAAYNESYPVRLIPFISSVTDALTLEFGHHYIRVVQTGVVIVSPYSYAHLFNLHYVQSGDVVTITHQSFPPAELKRINASTWTLTNIVFGPVAVPPTAVVVTGTAGSIPFLYWVTTVDAATGEESLSALSNAPVLTTPDATHPHNISWVAAAGAGHYRVYRQAPFQEAVMGFIGITTTTSFTNSGIVPDFSQQVPVARPLFNGAGKYPAEVSYYQQRLLFANSLNEPEKIWGSKTGNFKNFLTTTPLQDDDAVTFTLAGREISAVQFLLNLGKLVVCSGGGEWLVEGDNAGVLTPSSINTRVGSYNGCADLRPLLVGNTVIYVQSLGNVILDLRTNIMYGYYTFEGSDLTLFSSHLFEGYSIVDWAWQQVPHYTVWAVRSDGTLLGLTYVKEQQLLAWHRHDTDGIFESVCTIPEGNENRLYAVVRRTINGATRRYIERLARRNISDTLSDVCFLDSSLTYDGRKSGSSTGTTLMLSGGAAWDQTESITLTASAAEFVPTNVGDQRVLRDAAGEQIKFTIAVFVSSTVVTGHVDKLVPVSLRGVACTDWDRAVRAVGGVDHLNGKSVGIFADGFVDASPNNPLYTTPTIVVSGVVNLPTPRSFVRVGLPYLSDLQTLDIDESQGASLKERKINITAVGAYVENTRGVWLGAREPSTSTTDGLQELKIRNQDGIDSDSAPIVSVTDYVEMNVQSRWNNNGRVFIRQIDPLPMTILSIMPIGFIPPIGRANG